MSGVQEETPDGKEALLPRLLARVHEGIHETEERQVSDNVTEIRIEKIREIMVDIALGTKCRESFLTAFAITFIAADEENMHILLPSALALVAKYNLLEEHQSDSEKSRNKPQFSPLPQAAPLSRVLALIQPNCPRCRKPMTRTVFDDSDHKEPGWYCNCLAKREQPMTEVYLHDHPLGQIDPMAEDYIGHINACKAGAPCTCPPNDRNINCPWHGR